MSDEPAAAMRAVGVTKRAQDAAPRARLYVRVSTGEQTVENQARELRAMAEPRGFRVTATYVEAAQSGAKSDRHRAVLTKVLADAHAGQFDVLLVWALDRLSREGIGRMLHYLEQLRAARVRVMSLREPWLDTAGPIGDLLVAIFAWVAQQERRRLIERVVAGVRRAQANGTKSGKAIGRPTREIDAEEVRRRRGVGQSWREIARALKVPAATLRRRANGGGSKPSSKTAERVPK